jgi:hypothetical protein
VRWFKHMTDSWEDEKISKLVEQGGKDGLALYGAYWRVLEIVARQMPPKSADPNPSCSVKYGVGKWSTLMSVRGSLVGHYLGHLAKNDLVTVDRDGSDIRVTIPNLLKYRDEYSRKSGHAPENVRPRSDTDTDTDTDKRTNTFPSLPDREAANGSKPAKPTEPVESPVVNRPEVTQADLPIPHVNGRSPDPRQALPPPAAIPPTPKRDARTKLLPDQVEPFERSWAEYPRKDDKLGAQKKYAFAFETKEQREYFYSRVLAHKPYMESAEDRRFIPLMETFISKEKYKNLTPKEEQCQKRQTATMNTEARATVANGYEVPMK